MTRDATDGVQVSCEAAKPHADVLIGKFYATLFARARNFRSMFPSDLAAKRKKLTTVLTTAVGALTQLDALVPVLHSLGARHVGYGVDAAHYDLVGQALLAALETALEDDWSDETANAWVAIYCVIKATMLEGAGSVAQAA